MEEAKIQELEKAIAVLQEENTKLKEALAGKDQELEAKEEEVAEAIVEQAVKDGKIEPDKEIKAKWKKLVKTNEGREILAKLAPNPAFSKAFPDAGGADRGADDKSAVAIKAKFESLKGKDRTAFFNANRDVLMQFKGR